MVSGLQYKVSAISTDILKKNKTDEHMLKSLHSSKEVAQLQSEYRQAGLEIILNLASFPRCALH